MMPGHLKVKNNVNRNITFLVLETKCLYLCVFLQINVVVVLKSRNYVSKPYYCNIQSSGLEMFRNNMNNVLNSENNKTIYVRHIDLLCKMATCFEPYRVIIRPSY